MAKVLTVVHVDHDLEACAFVSSAFNNLPQFKLLAQAHSGKEALNICPSLMPDCIIIYCSLPDMMLVDFIRQLKKLCPKSSIVTSSVAESSAYFEDMNLVGVRYFMSKPYTQEIIYKTLLHIAQQRKVLFGD